MSSSPLQAIRKHCLWCCVEQPSEVRECRSSKSCALHPYRLGRMPGIPGQSSLKAIRARCVDCVQGYAEVVRCKQGPVFAFGPCSLWPFRHGNNPNFSEATREKCRQRRLDSLRKKADSQSDSDTNEGEDIVEHVRTSTATIDHG